MAGYKVHVLEVAQMPGFPAGQMLVIGAVEICVKEGISLAEVLAFAEGAFDAVQDGRGLGIVEGPPSQDELPQG